MTDLSQRLSRRFHYHLNMKAKEAVAALAALAQDKRLAVYRLLVQRGAAGMAAGEIAAELGVTPATLSFHLKELGHAGLVRARPEGRFIFYSADFKAMTGLIAFLTENCCGGDPAACLPGPLTGAKCSVKAPSRRSKEFLKA